MEENQMSRQRYRRAKLPPVKPTGVSGNVGRRHSSVARGRISPLSLGRSVHKCQHLPSVRSWYWRSRWQPLSTSHGIIDEEGRDGVISRLSAQTHNPHQTSYPCILTEEMFTFSHLQISRLDLLVLSVLLSEVQIKVFLIFQFRKRMLC